MVFVTVGSQKFPFDRLIKKVDQMIREGVVQEEVFMQTGTSGYTPQCCHQAFCPRDEFSARLGACRVLITHGGAGTMIDAIKRGKKVIAVPRLSRYGEHVDDHQMELTSQLHRMNLLCSCPDLERLPEVFQAVQDHAFDRFQPHTEAFICSLEEDVRWLSTGRCV